MKKLLLLLALLAFNTLAGAQHNHGGTAGHATYMTPDMNMPAGKIYIDTKTIPHRHHGFSNIRVRRSCGPLTGSDPSTECGASDYPNQSFGTGQLGGAFRLSCQSSHWTFDDPIVKPRQSGMTHLHQFFGNTTTNAQSDASKMDEFGDSTCSGGIANRTGYWTPVLIYHCPAIEVGCDRARDGEVIPAFVNNAYYKAEGAAQRWIETNVSDPTTAAAAVVKMRTLKWWPKGFRMINGDPNNVDPARMRGMRFDCFIGGVNIGGNYTTDHIANTAEAATLNSGNGCDEVNLFIAFPQCTIDDESVLYLPTPVGGTGSAHVDMALGSQGAYQLCSTPGFSRLRPEITYNIHTKIPHLADWDYVVLSSDLPVQVVQAAAGSTTTAIHLPTMPFNDSVDELWTHGAIMWNGERRYITAWNSSTRIATVSSAFSTAPPTGATVGAKLPAGRSAHGDWANGWDTDPNFMGWGRSVTDQIIRGCHLDEARFGTLPNSSRIDCHDNLIGDPRDDTTNVRAPGAEFWYLY